MPKYYDFKVSGYYLYFTSFCVIECMHAHASDRKLTEAGSAKLFVKEDGETVIAEKGLLTDRDLRKIQLFIKERKAQRAVAVHWINLQHIAAYTVFPGLVRILEHTGFSVGKVLPERQIRVLGPQERNDGEGRQEGDDLFHICINYQIQTSEIIIEHPNKKGTG